MNVPEADGYYSARLWLCSHWEPVNLWTHERGHRLLYTTRRAMPLNPDDVVEWGDQLRVGPPLPEDPYR